METTSTFALSAEELQLAARNHGMPLEMLREPITPVGLHYLLIHFDIPAVDAAGWRLQVGGRVEQPLTLSLEDVKARPARTVPVTRRSARTCCSPTRSTAGRCRPSTATRSASSCRAGTA